MSKHLTEEEAKERFEKFNPTMIIVGNIGATSQSDVNIHCLNCNADFTRKRFDILRKKPNGCPYCRGLKKLKGFNDIGTTHPHLLKYFVNPNDAYSNSKGSHNIVEVHCPHCGHKKSMQVKNLVNQRFKCDICDSGISFPNRIARAFLSQLPIQNWICEYRPEWSKRKFYDNYFEYNNKKYILEMDGGIGHGKRDYHHFYDLQGLINDNLKDNLAREHEIEVIRIDCELSKFNYIKTNIEQSRLAEIFDLRNFDWNKCYIEATDNLYIKICNYYSNSRDSLKNIASKFKVSMSTVCIALKTGQEIGIIDYSKEETRKNKAKHNSETQKNRVRIEVDLYKGQEYIGRFNNVRAAARKMIELSPSQNINLNGVYSAVYNNRNTYQGFILRRSGRYEP